MSKNSFFEILGGKLFKNTQRFFENVMGKQIHDLRTRESWKEDKNRNGAVCDKKEQCSECFRCKIV